MTERSVPSTVDRGDERSERASDRLRQLTQGKGLASGFSLLMICAVLWPIVENWREQPTDSFPLSYYPMFTEKRAEKARVTYMVGFDAQGNRELIPYPFAGTGGLNQVRKQIRKVAQTGKATELCRSVAARIAQSKRERFADVESVQIVTGDYRLADYFSGNKSPVSERVNASCQVERDL
jgi:hypothetical protein